MRTLLNIIVFISGAVLMSLEIVGSRVLAPFFGNSIFVWGSLISVFLAALSVGYYWGGRLSDRNPSFERLLVLIFIPGLMISALPFLYPDVNPWIATVDFGTRLNPLIASLLYFLLPSIFLGTTSPYAIRLSAQALATVGSTAGTLYALSTCGSIFGTLFTAFYLIPLIGVTAIIHSLGVTLMTLSLISWPLIRLLAPQKVAVAFLGLLVCVFVATPALARSRLLLEKDSLYHRIRVEEDEESRSIYFDRTLQSAMDLSDPTRLTLLYSQYASLGLAFRPAAKNALIIGLGGGSIPKKYHKEFPSLEIDVAEIDPEVVEAAKRYFHFKEAKNLRVYAQDGRLFVTRTSNRYDLMLLDAYFSDTIPFHLTTREFFQTAHQKLSGEGVLVINVIGAITGPGGKITRSIVKTLRPIFPQIYVFPTRRGQGATLDTVQNVILVATKETRRIAIDEIVKRASELGRGLFPSPISQITASYHDAPISDQDVPVLTDDYAPTDSLLHPR